MEPELFIFSENAKRLPNTSFIEVGASRAVTAMGLLDKSPKGAIRISLGYTSIIADVEHFLSAWAKIRKTKRKAA